jgi:hypothetical protein
MQPKRPPDNCFSVPAIPRMLIGLAFPLILALFIFSILVPGNKELSACAVFNLTKAFKIKNDHL